MIVVYLRRVPCPRAEGGAYNSTGRRARTCNTFRALRRPEGSKAPVTSFPDSTFPARVQGMVLGAMVDPNVLSCPVPIIMREWVELSGKMKPVFRYRAGRGSFLAVWRNGDQPLSLGRDRPRPSGVGRGEVYPSALGRDRARPIGVG